MKFSLKNIFSSRKFQYGSNAIILILVVIGILILLNFLAYKHDFRWDLTENKRFSLSDQTRKILKNLEEEVQIVGFFQEGSGTEQMVARLLDRYQKYTDKLKVEFIDPDKNPAKAKAYEVSSYGTTVFVSEKREKKVPQHKLFTYARRYQDQKFKAEEEFTRAIIDVTRDSAANINFVSGHGEYSLDTDLYQLKDSLNGEGYKVSSINLAKDGVPDETDLLVIAGPKRDYNGKEISLIRDYLDRGGELFFLLNPSYEQKGIQFKNLVTLLKDWGMKADDNVVIDRKQSYFFDPFTPIADLRYHDITSQLREEDLVVVLPMTRSLSSMKGYEGDAEKEILMETSSEAWGETDYTAEKFRKDENDLAGPLNLAYAVTRKVELEEQQENSNEKDSNKDEKKEEDKLIDNEMKAVVMGTASLLTDKILQQQGNQDFVLNTINWLVGQEEKISIRPKGLGIRFLYLSPGASRLIFYGTVLGMPLLVFLVGGIIFFRRRHL